jgi:hypothetical protein
MAQNYILLETINLTQTAASVTFDNIPQTGYTDLKIVGSVRSDYSGQAIALRINPNGSSTNMSSRNVQGSGSALSSFNDTIAYASSVGSTSTANTFSNIEWYIPNYTSSRSKSISVDYNTETNGSAAIMGVSSGLWSQSSAISSLVILTTSGNLTAGSTFSLYGVAALGTTPVTAPFASGGNIVANDGTYWYHAFLSSGTFTPTKALTCDYLVVAGGGAGGTGYYGGGGGAGGLRSTVTATGGGGSLETALSLTAQNYTVTIGAGGAGTTSGNFYVPGNSGSNSTFSTITSVGGGGGGSFQSFSGITGGSGGGDSSGLGSAGSGTANQGRAGALGGNVLDNRSAGGGGGGAGTAGGSPSGSGGTGTGGAGGAGVAISAFASPTNTSVSNYYAGGGGGGYGRDSGVAGGNVGPGGAGGGGNGSTNGSAGSAGTVNTGGGGGGAGGYPAANGAGGSGIVIIRYAMV